MKIRITRKLTTLMITLAMVFGILQTNTLTTLAATSYYVSTSGSDSNAGTSSSKPFKTLAKAVSSASSGATIYIASGTYSITSTIKLTKSNTSGAPIKIVALSGTPVLDFSSQTYADSARGIQISGSYYTISGLKIIGAGDNGIFISGSYNTVQSCTITKCRDTGLQISNGGANNHIKNVTSTYNYDPKTSGENADGFAAKLSIGAGNWFEYCYAYNNSDDGFDLYYAGNAVKIYNSEASYNGVGEGNGNGFKIGGNYTADKHYLENCKAVGNKLRGYDQNNNTGALTLYKCVGDSNYVNFYLSKAPSSGKHLLTNCTSTNGKSKDVVVGATLVNTTLKN